MHTKQIVAGMFLLAVVGGAESARAGGDELRYSEFLFPGQRLTAPGCFYFTEMQKSDGNLVTYVNNRTPPLGAAWASGTQQRGGYAVHQIDGNFVIYNWNDQAVWASNTWGHFGERLVQQADGNLVEYASFGAIWSSGVVLNSDLSAFPCLYPSSKTQVSFDTARPGSNYSQFSTPRYSWCGYYCAQDSNCKAWTFSSGQCSLKNAVPGPTAQSGATSGVIVH